MNRQDAVVMGFFTFRVFLVGTIFLVYPRVSRRGLMFGTYLGEEQTGGPTRVELLRMWDRGCILVMLFSLLVGWSIGFSARPLPGNLIGTAVLLVSFIAVYLWTYRKARKHVQPHAARQGARSVATLDVDEARGSGFAVTSLAVCLITSLALAVYGIAAFRSMPDRVPTLANVFGFGEELTDKSLVAVMLVPSFNLVLTPFFALMALLIAGAKRSVRGGSGGRSSEAQRAFRVAASHAFAGTALFLCLFLGVTAREMIRVWQGRAESLGGIIGVVAGFTILYMGASLIRMMVLGQGGARLESGSVEAPLTGGLADDTRWILGVMYVNRSDPAMVVESRFGIGYTMNLGNPLALMLTSVYLAALLALTVLTLVELGVFT